MRPRRSMAVLTTRSPSGRLIASATSARPLPPAASMPSIVPTISASVRAVPTTVAPASASTRAMPAPTPFPAPVTIATCPSSRNCSNAMPDSLGSG